ncbi:MAG: hypothetical protein AAF193_08725, partial [Bacteroidota bacterium]
MRNFLAQSFVLILMMAISSIAIANNIQVSNVEVVDQIADQETYVVQFDLSWENSWRTSSAPNNHDAAWVFIKWRNLNGEWHHAELYRQSDDAAADGHVFAPGSTGDIPDDQVGMFVYRDSNGNGHNNFQQMQLLWDYSAEVDLTDDFEIAVYAIEMVYVPEGSFYLGSEDNYTFSEGTLPLAFFVDSEDEEITLGGGSNGSLWNGYYTGDDNNPDDFDDVESRTLPAEWPIGYHAYYVMKY